MKNILDMRTKDMTATHVVKQDMNPYQRKIETKGGNKKVKNCLKIKEKIVPCHHLKIYIIMIAIGTVQMILTNGGPLNILPQKLLGLIQVE